MLKKHIEASGKVSLPIFVDEISANTKGYELLFKPLVWGDVNGEEGYEKRVKILQSYGILTLFYFLYMDSQKL